MKESRTSLEQLLPPSVAACLREAEPSVWDTVQEVRLRAGAPLRLSTACGEIDLSLIVTPSLLQESFLRLCEHAVHTHQEELAQGFVTAKGGFRVGVAGTAVLREGAVSSYRSLTSLCIRIPRRADGCAAPLLPFLLGGGGVNGLLICGAPSTGKTTLLRDLARLLGATCRVAVVDERAELSAEPLTHCDVLRGCSKTVGMLQAVRTLAPDMLIVDELGGEGEWRAVTQCLFCGTAVTASAHITSPKDLVCRPFARRALEMGGFAWVLQLPPRDLPHEEATLRRAGEYLEGSGDPVARMHLRRARLDCGVPPAAV